MRQAAGIRAIARLLVTTPPPRVAARLERFTGCRRTIRAHASGMAAHVPAFVTRRIDARAVGQTAGLRRAGVTCTVGVRPLRAPAVIGARIRCVVVTPPIDPTTGFGIGAIGRCTISARALRHIAGVRAIAWLFVAASPPCMAACLEGLAERRCTNRINAFGIAADVPAFVMGRIGARAVGQTAGLRRAGVTCTVSVRPLRGPAVIGARIRRVVIAVSPAPTTSFGLGATG